MGNVLTDRWMDLRVSDETIRTPREAATYLIRKFMPRYLPWEVVIGKTPSGDDVKAIKTGCNILFTDVVQLLKLDGPYHWVDKKGNPLRWATQGTAIKGDELSANKLVDWFHTYGMTYGYLQMSRQEAESVAKEGKLVAVMWKNPDPNASGHIGGLDENGKLWQAGKGIPFVGHPIEEGFGNKPFEFWGYVEKNRNEG